MTDKEKIRKEIEKRYEYWKEREFNSHSIESEIRMSECQHLLLMIDSLQEEPKSQFKVGDTIRSKVWERAVHKIVYMDDSAYFFENGGMVRLADQEQWELAEEPVSEDLEEELPKVWDRETLDEYAYQVAYDLSNDWMKDTATWDDVETAVKLGARWQKERKENG